MNKQLEKIINDIAQVAGYLWQKGWAERNGGNITDEVDDDIRSREPISEKIAIGITLPNLSCKYFFCKSTNKRMRDLVHYPMDNGSIIRVCDDGAHYEIIAENPVMPTSELPAHLAMHSQMIERGNGYKAALHTRSLCGRR